MVSIELINYTGKKETVNKTLTPVKTIQGTLKDYFNYLNPSITVRLKDLNGANYCYIEVFKRYYFISDVIVRSNNVFELLLQVDVLKSYENEILQATGETIRTQTPDPYNSGRTGSYSLKPEIKTLPFPIKDLFKETGSIIMVTIKGTPKE